MTSCSKSTYLTDGTEHRLGGTFPRVPACTARGPHPLTARAEKHLDSDAFIRISSLPSDIASENQSQNLNCGELLSSLNLPRHRSSAARSPNLDESCLQGLAFPIQCTSGD